MSDWGDEEPGCAVISGLSEKFEKSVTTKTNEPSAWSDDEKQPGSDGGGRNGQRDEGNGFRGRRDGEGDGGYRGRRDDGGERGYRGRRDDGGDGGYRGRRDDAGEGGYRGRRDGGEDGVFRGRRDNGDGGGYRGRREEEDGGFRGRRGDNEDVMQLLRGSLNGLRVPVICDKESVETFINGIDLNSTSQSLAKLREQRDYLLAAFTQLVNSEWTSLEEKRRDERKLKALQLRDAVASSDRIIAEINRLISDAKDERQQLHTTWVTSDMDTFMVPNAPRRQQRSQEITTPKSTTTAPTTTPATKTTRKTLPRTQPPSKAASDDALCDQVVDSIDLNETKKIQRVRQLLERLRKDYESTDGIIGAPRKTATERVAKSSSTVAENQPQVPFVFHRWMPEDSVSRHLARNLRYCMPRELRKNLSWPIFRSNSVWLTNKLTKSIVKNINNTIPSVARQQQSDQDPDQDQASSLLHLPRQQQSGNLDTPDNARLLLNSQTTVLDTEASAGIGATSTSNVGLSNDCLPPMPLTTPGSQNNLTDDDALSMPPPALPQDLPIETDMGTLPSVEEPSGDDNVPTSLVFRSRPQFASTPLQSYRPQLPAINEELQRPPTMGRCLEMSEHSPPPTPTVAAPAGIPTAAISLIPQNLPIRRDWTSIFRPREFVPDYAGQDVAQPRLKRRRIARRNTPERNEDEPRSNQEITTGFMAELLQTAAQEPEMGEVEAQRIKPKLLPENKGTKDTPVAPSRQMPETNKTGVPQESVEMPMEMDIPMSAFVSLDELPDRAIVTSNVLIYQPDFQSLNDGNQLDQTGMSSHYGPTTLVKLTQSTRVVEDSVASSADFSPKQQSVQDRLYGENLDDLAYIVEHTDMLRLMVDHQKKLSDEQKQTNLIKADCSIIISDNEQKNDADSQPRYISMPALYTYDPKILTDMSPLKQRVVHSLIGALIMYPTVKLRSAPFIKTRMEAAIAFRVLLELKSADIINLSQDGQTASLR